MYLIPPHMHTHTLPLSHYHTCTHTPSELPADEVAEDVLEHYDRREGEEFEGDNTEQGGCGIHYSYMFMYLSTTYVEHIDSNYNNIIIVMCICF